MSNNITIAEPTAQPVQTAAQTIEDVLIRGDLAKLTADQRTHYYLQVCNSLGLNPATKPFEFLTLNGKLILYARKDATEQLRKRDSVSIQIVGRELVDGVYAVTARAMLPSGRTDEAIGAVQVEGLKGESRANAFMKAETKAKRRVTLSICGLGMLDETETDSIENQSPVSASTPSPALPAGLPSPPPATESARPTTADVDRVSEIINAMKLNWADVRTRLHQQYGTDQLRQLTPVQLTEVEEKLKLSAAYKKLKNLPTASQMEGATA